MLESNIKSAVINCIIFLNIFLLS